VTGAGLEWKQRGAGWEGLRDRCGLEICGCGQEWARFRKFLRGRGGFKICGCGAKREASDA